MNHLLTLIIVCLAAPALAEKPVAQGRALLGVGGEPRHAGHVVTCNKRVRAGTSRLPHLRCDDSSTGKKYALDDCVRRKVFETKTSLELVCHRKNGSTESVMLLARGAFGRRLR